MAKTDRQTGRTGYRPRIELDDIEERGTMPDRTLENLEYDQMDPGERGRQARMNGLRMVMSETRRSRMGDRLPEGKRGRAAWLGGMPIDAVNPPVEPPHDTVSAVSPTPVREDDEDEEA